MEKVVKIGKQSVKLSNNMSWTMEYRDQFGKDVIQDHLPFLAMLTETMANVISDTGKTDFISISDRVLSLQGRTIDVFLPLMQTEIMSLVTNIIWAMAKAADEDIDPPKEWIRQFDEFPLDVLIPTIYEMAFKGFMSSKNWKRLMNLKKTIQPLQSTPSSSQESKED